MAARTRKAIFLDRDDTLLVDEHYMSDPAQVQLIDGVLAALTLLKKRGFLLVLVSNQSGVARQLVTPQQVRAIQQRMCQLLEPVTFARFEYCFHHPDDNCPCRKPKPAMILRASADLEIDPRRSYMVGDKESDVEAGNAAGCRTIRLGHTAASRADFVAPDWASVVDWILRTA